METRRLTTPEEYGIAARFEQGVYVPGLAYTSEELASIGEAGCVMGLFDGQQIIGVSSVALGPSRLWPNLTDNEAYMAGTAVHENYRGRGYGQQLAMLQEQAAIEAGRTRGVLTIALSNIPSLALRIGMGYRVVDAQVGIYSEHTSASDRLVLAKDLDAPVVKAAQEHAVLVPCIDDAFHLALEAIKNGYVGDSIVYSNTRPHIGFI